MGWDYALVHLFYTVPPAVLLHFLFSPVRNRRDILKIALLCVIAVISTTPWDSYLIRSHVWSYAPSSVLGISLFSIPIEECFFFIVQTYITSTLYLLLAKPIVHPTFLITHARYTYNRNIGVLFFAAITGAGAWMVYHGNEMFYLGLILTWAGSFLTFLVALAWPHLQALPLRVTLGSVGLPTTYLWLVDSWALRNGTWTIEKGTKLDWQLWGHLEIEEAVFFLLTNMLIVFGLVACDKAFAVMDAFPWMFPFAHGIPLARTTIQAVCLPPSKYSMQHLVHLHDAFRILHTKSRSFYLASMVFPDRCRLYLLSLYAFCRVVDDLVDEAPGVHAARESIENTREFLDLIYSGQKQAATLPFEMSPEAHAAFALLTMLSAFIPVAPLRDLLAGFESDLAFSNKCLDQTSLPIQTVADLLTYCERVASTVAQMFVYATWQCDPSMPVPAEREWILARATEMGVALQLVNIARDIVEDARNGRVYIPVEWFATAGELDDLDALLRDASDRELRDMLARYALRLVRLAKTYYAKALPGLDHLPRECSRGARLAIEVYMDIGRKIERRRGDVRERVIVDSWTKLCTVFKVLYR